MITALLLVAWMSSLNSGLMTDPATASGWIAVTQNPARLGSSGQPRWSMAYARPSASWASNALDIGEFVRCFMTGADLSEQDKAGIIDGIGPEPVRVAVSASLDAAHIQFGNYGLGANAEYALALSLPGDIVELALHGNELDRTYRLDGLGADTLLFSRVFAATGWDVWNGLCVGGGLSWLHGFSRFHTVTESGELTTTRGALWGYASQVTTVARGGDGVSLTIGFSGQLTADIELGLCARDALAGIWWYRETARNELSIRLDSVNLRSLQEKQDLGSFLKLDESKQSPAGSWSALPGVIALAANWRRFERVGFGLLVNAGLGPNMFLDRPPLLGARVDCDPTDEAGLSFVAGLDGDGEWLLDCMFSGLFGTQFLGVGITVRSASMLPASFTINLGFGAFVPSDSGVPGSPLLRFPGL